jgi:tRNA G37 N-methylase Trm5
VHENILEEEIDSWAHVTLPAKLEGFFLEHMEAHGTGTGMCVECVHVERVKSYAPRVIHIVVDLLCTPHTS